MNRTVYDETTEQDSASAGAAGGLIGYGPISPEKQDGDPQCDVIGALRTGKILLSRP
jgi:hypothetical protein